MTIRSWLDLNGVVAGSGGELLQSGLGGLKADGCCRRLERGRSWWKLLGVVARRRLMGCGSSWPWAMDPGPSVELLVVTDLSAMGRWRRGVLGEDERRRGDGSSAIVVEADAGGWGGWRWRRAGCCCRRPWVEELAENREMHMLDWGRWSTGTRCFGARDISKENKREKLTSRKDGGVKKSSKERELEQG
ncbi:hypothetical protein ACLOJK_018504 [Asimina triloba]